MTRSTEKPLRLNLPARPENVALARAAVGERAEAYGLEDSVVADLKTVVSEAAANVVLHAYVGANDPGPLEIEMAREETAVRVVIRDQGVGIRPQTAPAHASLKIGLGLIGAIARSFQLRSTHDQGTELSVALDLPPRR